MGDECEYYYYYDCLGLTGTPNDDWYCPSYDTNKFMPRGLKLKTSSKKPKMLCKTTTFDWGSSMATVGRSNTCMEVKPHHFGSITEVEVLHHFTINFRIVQFNFRYCK